VEAAAASVLGAHVPTVEEFARVTRNVIADEGFDDYLPTVLYPDRAHIAALEGVPAQEDLETIALEWAAHGAIGDEEFLVAFKIAPTKFKVIRRNGGSREEAVFDIRDDGA
jgi:hypothetical protein